jgi:hypothetical protein
MRSFALFSRLEVVLPHWRLERFGDSMPPAERRQCWIGQVRTTGDEFFMHSNQVPFALGQQLQNLLPVRFGFLRPRQQRHLRRLRT